MSALKRQVKEAMARVSEAGRDAQRFGARVADGTSTRLVAARKRARRMHRGLLAAVEERPGRTLAAVLGAGILLGFVVARRRAR
jgi:hypothetical protein